MSRHIPEPDPPSEFEDEGIPDLEDSTPEREWARDPQEPPVPGDRPVAVDDYGTTPAELRTGETLGRRLARELPDPGPDPEPDWSGQAGDPSGELWDLRPAGRLVAPDEGARPDAEPDQVAWETGPDFGGYSAEEAAVYVVDDPERLNTEPE